MRTILALLTALVVGAALSGCASFNQLNNDVSTYSQWPGERKPATYAFERLPSQQAQPQNQERLEQAARPALEAAGFRPASDPPQAPTTIRSSGAAASSTAATSGARASAASATPGRTTSARSRS